MNEFTYGAFWMKTDRLFNKIIAKEKKKMKSRMLVGLRNRDNKSNREKLKEMKRSL